MIDARPRRDVATSSVRGGVVKVMLPVLGAGVVAVLGIAIWASSGNPASPDGAGDAVPTVPTAGPVAPAKAIGTSTAHGSHVGFAATVQATSIADADVTLTALDVLLTTEDEPASAPTAEARLVGADRVKHDVPLTIIGPGHWTSEQFRIPAGSYRLTVTFHRRGGPVAISMTIVLTTSAAQLSPRPSGTGGSGGS